MSRTKELKGLIVGYDYISKQYYVTNTYNGKHYTTYRTDIDDIVEVIKVAGIDTEDMTGVKSEAEKLYRNYENLQYIRYTLSGTGSYPTTIILNDYDEYCIVLDLVKQKVYIKNSNIVLDLELNESPDSHARVLWEYYKEYIGLYMDLGVVKRIYNELILPYYKSNDVKSIYNLFNLQDLDDNHMPKYYSNVIANNNFDNKGLAEYNVVLNPDSLYTYTPIFNIERTDTNNNSIIVMDTIGDTLQEGDKIVITDSEITSGNYTYSTNGEYTIKSISNNIIYTEENIITNYEFKYKPLYLQVSPCIISHINRSDSSITFINGIPNTYEVGNIIHIHGTQQEVEGQQVTCDGTYTIQSISSDSKVVIVTEVFPTNYINPDNNLTTCTMSKETFISNIAAIDSNVIDTFTDIPDTLTTSNKVVIDNKVYSITDISEYYIPDQDRTRHYITVSPNIPDYNPIIAKVNSILYNTSMLLNVTYTTNEKLFPTTSFVLNNFTDLQEYIELLDNLPVPTEEIYNNINKVINTSIPITPALRIFNISGTHVSDITEMSFKGIEEVES